jgi:hypothetical protein
VWQKQKFCVISSVPLSIVAVMGYKVYKKMKGFPSMRTCMNIYALTTFSACLFSFVETLIFEPYWYFALKFLVTLTPTITILIKAISKLANPSKVSCISECRVVYGFVIVFLIFTVFFDNIYRLSICKAYNNSFKWIRVR